MSECNGIETTCVGCLPCNAFGRTIAFVLKGTLIHTTLLVFAASVVPIKCRVEFEPFPQYGIAEKVVKVVVIWFFVKRERAAVFKESAKLRREGQEQLVRGDFAFSGKNGHPFSQALPW